MLAGMTDPNYTQRVVLVALMEAHPRLLGVDDLTAKLSDVPRVPEALRVLVQDGLATRLGDRVGAARAAIRFREIGPV
jgi:hypothetical protein